MSESQLMVGNVPASELAAASIRIAGEADRFRDFPEGLSEVSGPVASALLNALDRQFKKAGAPNIHAMGLELARQFPGAFQLPGTARDTVAAGVRENLGLLSTPPMKVPTPDLGDGKDHTFKEEVTLYSGPFAQGDAEVSRVLKRNWWLDADPRAVGADLSKINLHLHPSGFAAAFVEAGGYTEVRRWVDANGQVQQEERTYRAGDVNVIPFGVAHEVVDVQPGTRSYFDWAAPTLGATWGYMQPDGKLVGVETVPFNKGSLVRMNFAPRLKPGQQAEILGAARS